MARLRRQFEIRLAGGYGFDHLERAIRDICPLMSHPAGEPFSVDLSGLAYIGPTALSLLVGVIKEREEEGCDCLIAPPKSELTRNYLQRMDVTRHLFDGAIPESFERKAPVGFRPVQHFRDDTDYWVAAKELSQALYERFSPDEMTSAAIRVCLDELTENVVQHAYTELGGFAAAQSSTKRKTFEVAIVDLGVGVRESLQRNPEIGEIADDTKAIHRALMPRVTSTPERNSGIGLFVTRMLLQANGGQLLVRSGRGAVYHGAKKHEEVLEASFPGTIVAIRAHYDRPLDLDHVYSMLAPETSDDDD